MLLRKNVLDFNAPNCHYQGFRVFRTGYWPGFKVKAWKIYIHFLKLIHFSKVRPFYVKRWKPVWIRACYYHVACLAGLAYGRGFCLLT